MDFSSRRRRQMRPKNLRAAVRGGFETKTTFLSVLYPTEVSNDNRISILIRWTIKRLLKAGSIQFLLNQKGIEVACHQLREQLLKFIEIICNHLVVTSTPLEHRKHNHLTPLKETRPVQTHPLAAGLKKVHTNLGPLQRISDSLKNKTLL